MNRTLFFIVMALLGSHTLLVGQKTHTIDTLPSVTPQTHQFLHMRVPLGELYMKSSGECGISFSRLDAPNDEVEQQIEEHVDENGNQMRYVELRSPGITPKGANLRTNAASSVRMSADFSTLNHYSAAKSCRSEFNPDPNFPTDLRLDLGVGASRLDFSGLSLRNVVIQSAFSDVMIAYHRPNQMDMAQLKAHVTKGDIVLTRPEMARARLISLQNDMGDTKIILGRRVYVPSTISLHAGVGSCTLIVDAAHPTQVIVKSGLFSDKEIGGSFEETEGQVYVNQAYRTHCKEGDKGCPHATRIICTLDMGSVAVMEKQ